MRIYICARVYIHSVVCCGYIVDDNDGPKQKKDAKDRKGRIGRILKAGEVEDAAWLKESRKFREELKDMARHRFKRDAKDGVQFQADEPWQSASNVAALNAALVAMNNPLQWDQRAISTQLKTVHRGQWQKFKEKKKKGEVVEKRLKIEKDAVSQDGGGDGWDEDASRAKLEAELVEKKKKRERHGTDRGRVCTAHISLRVRGAHGAFSIEKTPTIQGVEAHAWQSSRV